MTHFNGNQRTTLSRGWPHILMHASIHASMYASMHASMHACMYACMHPCIHACPWIHACMDACIHAYIHAFHIRNETFQWKSADKLAAHTPIWSQHPDENVQYITKLGRTYTLLAAHIPIWPHIPLFSVYAG